MDVREKYVMQKVSRKEKSICPNCIHHNLCIAENNQPCFECNRFIDANGVTVQEWISVNDKLPKDREWVIVWHTGYDTPKKAKYKDDFAPFLPVFLIDGDNGNKGEVTYWLPLPQPPKGE